jgi:tetratricopeptide (TPR) repeat protein
MNPQDEARDEDQISSLLGALNSDVPPPDSAALARLRAASTAVFGGERKARFGGRRVKRWLAPIAAAAVIALVALRVWMPFAPSGLPLREVFENSEKADTLHIRFARGDQHLEVWHMANPARSRWDDLAGHYRVADGARYWVVNESANEARRENPPAAAALPIRGFLEALGLGDEPASALDARPIQRLQDAGHSVLVYRAEVPTREGRIWMEALVRADTGRLHSLRTSIGELTVIAYDEPIGAEKFVIADTLTEDGRIGKVTDVQGIVGIKPLLHQRWTPVRENLVLRPGDWVRTDARGANAAAVRLVKQTGVILGPRTLVELVGPKKIRLIEGEIEITPAAETPVDLLGPNKAQTTVKGRQVYLVQNGQLVRPAKDPSWLAGFKGATTNEALGSLVALVDGRNVPLTVGYHKVTVDIRDQIARTVIEESFVNHTDAVLEGVFHFPLPPDASISGFGMWIGDKLVEADVVEKQRAREIYETILRERRDPGLLEWSGGNIFKARVFPIPANAEKRIKISYTQVLPLKGNRYRYSYALQSELLQQHPLRDLNIDVKLNSVVPLKSVTSPTHPTRNDLTEHSAHVEFTAQEYTPTRDFEVIVEVGSRQSDVVMIPHRRGDDGYFMLQLTPPGSPGDWDRPLLADGEPVQLLIVADTSASIDPSQRATQATFLGALLGALTPKDTFNVAASDVTCDWAFGQPTTAGATNIAAARDFLAKRTSLGWTNLDVAFASALKQAGPRTHIVYVGDGIVTTGDADPVAFAKRLRRLCDGIENHPTCHAIALGSSYESGVLKVIGSLGGGSVRKITSEQGPTAIARELLGEIAQPGLRDIKVEFKGLRVARVYPETLANVPAGSQQILLGRYLPEGRDQSGEVIVTGTQGGKPVRFSTSVSLKDAEEGNSFIPRLWARMHFDSLLDQGASDAIRDQIIALSEEYQIITPYTSLLVLESDADRERFKVARRFQMRDGERFFADGRNNAVLDLAQKQMKAAGAWRTALRRAVLADLARLGRNTRWFQPRSRYTYTRLGGYGGRDLAMFEDESPNERFGASELGAVSGEVPLDSLSVLDERAELGIVDNERQLAELDGRSEAEAKHESDLAVSAAPSLPDPLEAAMPADARGGEGLDDFTRGTDGDPAGGLGFDGNALLDSKARSEFFFEREAGGKFLSLGRRIYRGPRYGQWLNTLFPALSGAAAAAKERKSTWPVAAHELARSLLRTESLAKLTGGVEIGRKSDAYDPRWGDLTGESRRIELVGAKAWLTRSESDGGQTLISWCDGKEIGIFSQAFQLGRRRAAAASDVQPPPLVVGDNSMVSLEQTYAGYVPTLEPQGKDRTLLVLNYATGDGYETRILIDTARHVILSIEDRFHKKVTSTTTFDDFIEAGGTWWAQRIESRDENGKRVSLTTQTVKTLALKDLEARIQTELANRPHVQFLDLPMPSIAEAKRAAGLGKASFADHFVLLWHFLRSQQWPQVMDHLQQAEKLATGKESMCWVRSALLYDSRRHEELRQRYLAEAAQIARATGSDRYSQAEYIVNHSASVFQANEMLALLGVLRPVYDAQLPHVHGRKRWQQLNASYIAQTGRSDEALKLYEQLAADYPRDYALQQQYARALAAAGNYPAAYAWLTRVLVKEARWNENETEALRGTYAQMLQEQGRYSELARYLAEWVEQKPARTSAYEQYLSALVKSDQIEKADALALAWVKDAQVERAVTEAEAAQLYSGVQYMLGHAYQLYTNRVERRWLEPLSQAALFFARHPLHVGSAGQILSNREFSRTEVAEKLRRALAGILDNEIAKLTPQQIAHFIEWLQPQDAEPAIWNRIMASVRERWTKEPDGRKKHTLGQALVNLLARHDRMADLLAFLRVQRATGPEAHRIEYTNELFNRLLAQPWTAEIEAEAFTLFDKLSGAEDAGARLFSAVAALHRMDDAFVENRFAALMKPLTHLEKLTRTELRKKQDENRRLAREGLADRLRKEAARQPKALGRWLTTESLYFDLLLDRNLAQAAAEAWEVLGAAPPASAQAGSEWNLARVLDEVLRQRYLLTLSNLAARKGAEPALIERLLTYFDKGIGAEADNNRWKLARFRLLVALDRPKELEQALVLWTRQEDPDNRWRLALGYLLAEQGRLADAIREFEAIEAADELPPAAYRALAGWYLVQNQRDAHERAANAVYKTTPEHLLSRMIAFRLQPWQRNDGHLPTELDPEVLRIFAVLFHQSVTPQSYLWQLQQFYDACRDFRLLTGLADAVIGHTAAEVYPFLQGMQPVLSEVRDEATADEIVKRIAEVRPRAKSTVDQRALDLLEVLVQRRAAELQNQPGPHRERALAALVRASKREWSAGEPRLMADFLAGLGRIAQPTLAAEQLRQLKELHAAATPGTFDTLHIAHRRALTLNAYDRGADASDLLQTALNEFQAAKKGALPVSATPALESFIGLLENAGHFARGEKVLTVQLEHPVHNQQRLWLIHRLDELYHHALQRGGDVSLGKGVALYRALNLKIQKELATDDQDHRYQLITLICQVYRTAHEKKFESVVADIRAFAFENVPPILKQVTNNHESAVSTIASTVHDLAGPRDGIVFLLNEIESEPRWLRYANQDGWQRQGSTLGQWRLEAKDLGDAEGRLLKLVLTELRRDLESGYQRNRTMYDQRYDGVRFWSAKAPDFARTAEDVLAQRGDSSAAVQYIAEYFYSGLNQPNRAIDILLAAHKRKVLVEEGQAQLIGYLFQQNRHGEAIPLLEPLVQRLPGHLDYRVRLMHAYFRVGRQADLVALLKQTDAYFHEKDRWGEGPLAQLAHSTLTNELYEHSVAYYKELIPLHEREAPGRGIGDGTLADYYMGLAKAYAGLKKTPDAVDAASGSIVARGPRHKDRARSLETLKSVLVRSPDLNAFVAHFDSQKQDSAIIRTALGQAYREQGDIARAVQQLQLAVRLQPNDAETRKLLIESLDKQGNREAALRELLEFAHQSRRDLKLYEELGKRYAASEQPREAERAYTSIVEVQPAESESHALLAEIREKQERWSLAIEQWQQVARIRALEPTGLLKLAAALIHEKRWDEARETLRRLDSRTWPTRFGDVHQQVRKLEAEIAK